LGKRIFNAYACDDLLGVQILGENPNRSRKFLSFMQVISGTSNHTAQMKTLIEQQHRLSLGTLIGFVVAHKNFNLLGEEPGDRSSPAGSEDFGFSHGLATEAYGQVLLIQ
jgi:hypothetical protein